MTIYMMDTINLIFHVKGQEYLEKEILPKCVPIKRETKKGATLEYLIVVEQQETTKQTAAI